MIFKLHKLKFDQRMVQIGFFLEKSFRYPTFIIEIYELNCYLLNLKDYVVIVVRIQEPNLSLQIKVLKIKL